MDDEAPGGFEIWFEGGALDGFVDGKSSGKASCAKFRDSKM